MSGRLQGELEIEGACDRVLFYIYINIYIYSKSFY